uniref:Uncharacterized protein n=1 Tax=Romanomermis culicivorax TaxID=13658 RepID=A0A915L4U2_ROMCU
MPPKRPVRTNDRGSNGHLAKLSPKQPIYSKKRTILCIGLLYFAEVLNFLLDYRSTGENNGEITVDGVPGRSGHFNERFVVTMFQSQMQGAGWVDTEIDQGVVGAECGKQKTQGKRTIMLRLKVVQRQFAYYPAEKILSNKKHKRKAESKKLDRTGETSDAFITPTIEDSVSIGVSKVDLSADVSSNNSSGNKVEPPMCILDVSEEASNKLSVLRLNKSECDNSVEASAIISSLVVWLVLDVFNPGFLVVGKATTTETATTAKKATLENCSTTREHISEDSRQALFL